VPAWHLQQHSQQHPWKHPQSKQNALSERQHTRQSLSGLASQHPLSSSLGFAPPLAAAPPAAGCTVVVGVPVLVGPRWVNSLASEVGPPPVATTTKAPPGGAAGSSSSKEERRAGSSFGSASLGSSPSCLPSAKLMKTSSKVALPMDTSVTPSFSLPASKASKKGVSTAASCVPRRNKHMPWVADTKRALTP